MLSLTKYIDNINLLIDNKMNKNSSSVDFPFILNYEKEAKELMRKSSDKTKRISSIKHTLLHAFSNESMDLFRLDYGKEKDTGYHNRYLDHIKPIDRSFAVKEIEKNKEKIYLIDLLKSNHQLSQEPDVIKKIISNKESDFLDRRQKQALIQEKPKEEKVKEREIIEKHKLDHLYHAYNPNKLSIQLLSNIDKKRMDKSCFYYSTPKFPPAYLANQNDYSIEEAGKVKDEKVFKYKLKQNKLYNAINDQMTIVKDQDITLPKWSLFYENYLHVVDEGFSRRGGVFNEFVKMHPDIYSEVGLRNRRVDKIKEERLKLINKRNPSLQDNLKSKRPRLKYHQLLQASHEKRKAERSFLNVNSILLNNKLIKSKSERLLRVRNVIDKNKLEKLKDIYMKQ